MFSGPAGAGGRGWSPPPPRPCSRPRARPRCCRAAPAVPRAHLQENTELSLGQAPHLDGRVSVGWSWESHPFPSAFLTLPSLGLSLPSPAPASPTFPPVLVQVFNLFPGEMEELHLSQETAPCQLLQLFQHNSSRPGDDRGLSNPFSATINRCQRISWQISSGAASGGAAAALAGHGLRFQPQIHLFHTNFLTGSTCCHLNVAGLRQIHLFPPISSRGIRFLSPECGKFETKRT